MNVGTDCGLTIAGFYYVCFSCSDGSVNGFYYDPNSRLFVSSSSLCLSLCSVLCNMLLSDTGFFCSKIIVTCLRLTRPTGLYMILIHLS